MAKEITTSTWCDVCMAADEDTRTPAETTPPLDLQGTRAKARTLDLCPDHYTELVAPLAEALQAYGVTVQPPASASKPVSKPAKATTPAAAPARRAKGDPWDRPGPFACEVPGCKDRPRYTEAPTMSAFGQHVRRHGLTLAKYRAQYGEPGPWQQGERKGA